MWTRKFRDLRLKRPRCARVHTRMFPKSHRILSRWRIPTVGQNPASPASPSPTSSTRSIIMIYHLEFQSSLDGRDLVVVDESRFVERILKIIHALRKEGYDVSGSFHRTARRFVGEYQFHSSSETVLMSII